MIFNHNQKTVKQLLAEAYPPQRKSFKAFLRQQIVPEQTPERSPLFSLLKLRWLLPLGTASVLGVWGVFTLNLNQGIDSVVAQSIQNTFSQPGDSIRYVHTQEEVLDINGDVLFSTASKYWMSGGESRLDLFKDNQVGPFFSTLSFTDSQGQKMNCEFSSDPSISTPVLFATQSAGQGCIQVHGSAPFSAEDTSTLIDINPTVFMREDSLIFVQWTTTTELQADIQGYALPQGRGIEKDSFAPYTYYTKQTYPDGRPAPWDYPEHFINQPVEGGYLHSVFFPEIWKYTDDGVVETLQFQIQDELGYSRVYRFDTQNKTVIEMTAQELADQAELLEATVEYQMVKSGQQLGTLKGMQEELFGLYGEGRLIKQSTEVINGEEVKRFEYKLPPSAGMIERLELVFNPEEQKLLQIVEYSVNGESKKTNIVESLQLTEPEPDVFFSKEYWDKSLK